MPKFNFDVTREIAANLVGVSARRIKSMTFEDVSPKLHAKKIEGRWMWDAKECKSLRKERAGDEGAAKLAKEWDKLHKQHGGMITLAALEHPRAGSHKFSEAAKAKARAAKKNAKAKATKKQTQTKAKGKNANKKNKK